MNPYSRMLILTDKFPGPQDPRYTRWKEIITSEDGSIFEHYFFAEKKRPGLDETEVVKMGGDQIPYDGYRCVIGKDRTFRIKNTTTQTAAFFTPPPASLETIMGLTAEDPGKWTQALKCVYPKIKVRNERRQWTLVS